MKRPRGLWINGIEALDRQAQSKGKRTGGVRAVYDLSATPFFPARLGLSTRGGYSPGWCRISA